MQVALVSEHASPLAAIGVVDAGGQNVHVAELAGALVRRGHEVTVYTRRDDPALPERVRAAAGYAVVHLDAGPAQPLPKDKLWVHMPAFAARLQRAFERERPDVAHAHFWMSAWATRAAVRSLGIPLLITFHALGAVKHRYQGAADTSPGVRVRIETAVAGAADRVIATCTDEVRELARLGVSPEHVVVVPCGVDTDHFSPLAAAEVGDVVVQAERSVRPRRSTHRLLTVGRLVERKGYGVAVAALTRLPDTELVIAGGLPSGPGGTVEPEQARLTALADDLGVADRVHFVGQVGRDALPGLLRSADVVVCSPWYEPFGLVPLEAMACGVPVVASAVGGMLDTVSHEETGLLVRPRDPAALAGAVSSLLSDPDRRIEFGRAGVDRVRSHYSWSAVAAASEGVYAAVLRTRAGRTRLDHAALAHATSDHATSDHAAFDHAAFDHAGSDRVPFDHAAGDHADRGRVAPALRVGR